MDADPLADPDERADRGAGDDTPQQRRWLSQVELADLPSWAGAVCFVASAHLVRAAESSGQSGR